MNKLSKKFVLTKNIESSDKKRPRWDLNPGPKLRKLR
jgi:hypothetical protein